MNIRVRVIISGYGTKYAALESSKVCFNASSSGKNLALHDTLEPISDLAGHKHSIGSCEKEWQANHNMKSAE